MHRLVQAVTRDRLPPTSGPNGPKPPSQWVAAPSSGEESPSSRGHGRPVHGYCPMRWPWSVMWAIRTMPRWHGILWNQMGVYLHARAQLCEAKPYYERALAIGSRCWGPSIPIPPAA